MRTVTIAGALESEAKAKSEGWSEEQLLELAGQNLAIALSRFFPQPGLMVGYLGKGHNAGDALVALRILRDFHGWAIHLRTGYPIEEMAPLTQAKWRELGEPVPLKTCPIPPPKGPLVLLDGLLGTGAKGPIRDPLSRLAGEMETLRQTIGARVASIDLPSGIDADSGEIADGAVTADITFMIGNPKLGLLSGIAVRATGALACVPVLPLASACSLDLELVAPQIFHFGKQPRPFDFHKGMAGRVAIFAGSREYPGAAVLAASGALRGGGGLVTLFVPSAAHAAVSARCPAEIIVRPCDDAEEVLASRFDSLVVGCGLGEMDAPSARSLFTLIENSPAPVVVDADALNIVAKAGKTGILSDRHVITPHPGEFRRLAPDLADLTRENAASRFAARIPAVLLLKGARTLVTQAGHSLRVNSTGTPAMATGGQGDLLAGVIGARLAVGDNPLDAATLAAWVCGHSAELALNSPGLSEESLLPSDVLRFLGTAFNDWRSARR